MSSYLFTSESVTEGHPDKICDQISDAILDACLKEDPYSRVACETAIKDNHVWVFGEITSTAKVDFATVAREVVQQIGYDSEEKYLAAKDLEIDVKISQQSGDIAQGVDSDSDKILDLGAGDQGMMFGYACRDTDLLSDAAEVLMPLPIYLAHQLTKKLAAVRHEKVLPWVYPDGKSQVTVEYSAAGIPQRIDTVLISTQHAEDVSNEEIKREIRETVITPVIPSSLWDDDTRVLINPTGRFVVGGPVGDSGLTGRKIIVDSYGGMSRHGGGAVSGKDPTKVDRTGKYLARHVAKSIVANNLADRCEVQLAYAIGVAEPVSILVDTFGTEKKKPEEISAMVGKKFDLRPGAAIKQFDLLRPIYAPLATYGQMGRADVEAPWEQVTEL